MELIETARRLLSLPAPWMEGERCRLIAKALRRDGEHALADQLDQAAEKPVPWLGSSVMG